LITDEWVQGVYADSLQLTAAHRKALETSDILIEELLTADTLVIGAPMYNFTVSAALKGWIDQVVRVGKTIAYGPNGRTGLLKGKRVVVITSRGGAYAPETPAAKADFQEPYLRQILGFMGLTDVTFIHAENQQGGELAEHSQAAALERIAQIAAESESDLRHVPA
jgi:FMN-dependent NADH-azoreductase